MNEIQVFEKKFTAPELFQRSVLEEIVNRVRAEASSHVPDLSTATGRKNIASLARKVASTKTLIDDAGKAYVAELKDVPKKIDSERRWLRESLDAIRDEVRSPLTEWEEERSKAESLISEINSKTRTAISTSCQAACSLWWIWNAGKTTIHDDMARQLSEAVYAAETMLSLRFQVLAQEEVDRQTGSRKG